VDRQVIVTIDGLVELFKDYFPEGDLPDDTRAVKLMINPSNRKFAIVVESDTWTGEQPPLIADFQIKRVFGV
jgi:hypothetical protein